MVHGGQEDAVKRNAVETDYVGRRSSKRPASALIEVQRSQSHPRWERDQLRACVIRWLCPL